MHNLNTRTVNSNPLTKEEKNQIQVIPEIIEAEV